MGSSAPSSSRPSATKGGGSQSAARADLIELVATQSCQYSQKAEFHKRYREDEEFKEQVWWRESSYNTDGLNPKSLQLRKEIGFLEFKDPLIMIPEPLKDDVMHGHRPRSRQPPPSPDLLHIVDKEGKKLNLIDLVVFHKFNHAHLAEFRLRYVENIEFRKEVFRREASLNAEAFETHLNLDGLLQLQVEISLLEFETSLVMVPQQFRHIAQYGDNLTEIAQRIVGSESQFQDVREMTTQIHRMGLSTEQAMRSARARVGRRPSPSVSPRRPSPSPASGERGGGHGAGQGTGSSGGQRGGQRGGSAAAGGGGESRALGREAHGDEISQSRAVQDQSHDEATSSVSSRGGGRGGKKQTGGRGAHGRGRGKGKRGGGGARRR